MTVFLLPTGYVVIHVYLFRLSKLSLYLSYCLLFKVKLFDTTIVLLCYLISCFLLQKLRQLKLGSNGWAQFTKRRLTLKTWTILILGQLSSIKIHFRKRMELMSLYVTAHGNYSCASIWNIYAKQESCLNSNAVTMASDHRNVCPSATRQRQYWRIEIVNIFKIALILILLLNFKLTEGSENVTNDDVVSKHNDMATRMRIIGRTLGKSFLVTCIKMELSGPVIICGTIY